MTRRYAALLLSGVLACAGLSGCSSDRNPDAPEAESSIAEAAEQTTAATTSAATESETTQSETQTTEAVTETTANDSSAAEHERPAGSDTDTKILWSERGLEAVAIDSTDGYGEELTLGSEYLGWRLDGFDGSLSGTDVSQMNADFSYQNGTLQQNGQIRLLPSSDAHYPNGLYMHADNIADFPYFPKDTRDRGWFVIENADEVLKMLDLESADDISGDLSVSVSIDKLEICVFSGSYDTVHVTAASKR